MEIRYKAFRARIYFSPETDSFYGEVLEIPWLLCFQAKDVPEAKLLMQEVVERYLLLNQVASSFVPSTVLE